MRVRRLRRRACITEPAPRNSPALKKACVARWKMLDIQFEVLR